MEVSWGVSGPCWALVGAVWGVLGTSWGVLKARGGASWGLLGRLLRRLGDVTGTSWQPVAAQGRLKSESVEFSLVWQILNLKRNSCLSDSDRQEFSL